MFENFLFGNPTNLLFHNYTLDQKPVSWSNTDDGYRAICRTVGVNPDDVNIEVVDGGINLTGSTTVDGEEYSVSYFIPISSAIMAKVENIQYESKNGLTYIYLNLQKIEKKQIQISKM